MRSSKDFPYKRAIPFLLGLAALWPLSAIAAPTETVLYNFGPTSGTSPTLPLGGVTLDAAGNIYGTTEYGGMYERGRRHQGTIYELSASGQFTVLKNLEGRSAFPQSGVTLGGHGNIYGTTFGAYRSSTEGSVFVLRPTGHFAKDVFLPDATGPLFPQSRLLLGKDGNLYGTSLGGGIYGGGTAFKVLPSGAVSVLHSFGATISDPTAPSIGALTSDDEGNLYGATSGGGTFDEGTIYKIDASGTQTILYDGYLLSGYSDACSNPRAGLIRDNAGNLYGTTSGGGGDVGCIFQLTAAGVFNILYVWPYVLDEYPIPNGDLLRNPSGDLFGTTQVAGAYSQGSVFEFTASGVFRTLYSFTGGADGGRPTSGLSFDAQGNLYGTASTGGANGGGVVFKITP